jgi:hypothetical protein
MLQLTAASIANKALLNEMQDAALPTNSNTKNGHDVLKFKKLTT